MAMKTKSKWDGVIKPAGDIPDTQNAEMSSTPQLGRPRSGKRSNPDYRQVSAWIRNDTHNEVTTRLFHEDRREFSELVQTLLEEWLKVDTKKTPAKGKKV